MYEDMQSNPNFGSTAATEQAKLALQYANEAKGYLDSIESNIGELDRVDSFLTTITEYVAQLQDTMAKLDADMTTATGLVNTAKATASKVSDDALASEKWATSTESPDGNDDADSETGKTQSSRSWALDSKVCAINAKESERLALEYKNDAHKALETLGNAIVYQGSVDAYADLPTTNKVGDMYNIKTKDKTHGINAGDNVVWNGTEWDNVGSYFDMDGFVKGTVGTDFPDVPSVGEFCYRTDTKKLYQYNGEKWESSFGGGLSIWAEDTDYEVDNCVIYKTYIYRCKETHTSTSEFEYDKWVHVGGYAGNFFKYNADTDTIEPKTKDEITLTDLVTDDETVRKVTESYCKLYGGSLWKYENGELVPKTMDEITSADLGAARETIVNIAKENCLPLSGGAMTGKIQVNPAPLFLSMINNTSVLELTGGSNGTFRNGANLELHGADEESVNAGAFILRANDTDRTSRKDLLGKADGTFTWGGKEIKSMAFPSATNVNISASTATYTAPANGYISVFGKASSTNGFIQLQNNFVIDYKVAYSIGEFIGCTIPIKKGQTVNISVARMTISWIRFTYAEGEI